MASIFRAFTACVHVRRLLLAAVALWCALNARAVDAGCGDYLHYVPRIRDGHLPVRFPTLSVPASRHETHNVRLPYVPRKCHGPSCNPTAPAPTSSTQMVEVKSGSDRLLTVGQGMRPPERRVSHVATRDDSAPMPGHPSRLRRPPRS